MDLHETDTVVLGLGAMGSAALYHLALRGVPALGIEQFRLGHDQGSTNGPSRVFRPFYANPLYVEMARVAQAQWQELERRAQTRLLRLCGQLVMAQPGNALFQECLKGLQAAREEHDPLTRNEAARRFPMMRLPSDSVACWVPRAGFLEPEHALSVLIAEARKAGADVWDGQGVTGLSAPDGRLELATRDRRVRCQRLICTGGSWTASLLPDLRLDLKVTRQQKFHFRSDDVADLHPDRMPVYTDYDLNYYGFPVWGGILNVADDNWGDFTDPNEVDRSADEETRARMQDWVEALFPNRGWQHVHTETCLYTNTPDDDFILDRHPEIPNVIIGAGFSGHGFKFTPVIGDLLVQLALGETPNLDIQALGLRPERKLSL